MRLVDSKNPILHTEIEPMSKVDIILLEQLSYDMLEFMKSNSAVGLASPQIGLKHRLFVMYPDKRVFNPEILEQSNKEKLYDEGCLSFPGIFMKVKRPTWVTVRYTTIQGGVTSTVEETLKDIEAQCFCHELDHLNGITFDQRVSRAKFERAKKKRDKKLTKV